MTVDWFLVDAPQAVPREFQAWEAAKERHRAVFLSCCDAKNGSPEQAALDAEGRALTTEAEHLENIARAAWAKTLKT